jgi:hypothetical protein
MFPPNKEAEMRVIIPTLVGLAGLVAVSAQAAPNPSNAYPHGKRHETPAQNVWKSQQYDYLLALEIYAAATHGLDSALGRPMQPCPDPRHRLIVPHPENALRGLHPIPGAPAGHEGAR